MVGPDRTGQGRAGRASRSLPGGAFIPILSCQAARCGAVRCDCVFDFTGGLP